MRKTRNTASVTTVLSWPSGTWIRMMRLSMSALPRTRLESRMHLSTSKSSVMTVGVQITAALHLHYNSSFPSYLISTNVPLDLRISPRCNRSSSISLVQIISFLPVNKTSPHSWSPCLPSPQASHLCCHFPSREFYRCLSLFNSLHWLPNASRIKS